MKKEKINGKVVIQISIMWFFVLALFGTFTLAFFKNTIFASDIDVIIEDEEPEPVDIEPNENAVDILELMVANNYTNKKLVNEERDIKYETKIENDSQMPKGEKTRVVEGKLGKVQVTALQQYEENQLKEEEIIETVIVQRPVTEIIHVGTSDFLAKYKVHIGDEMFLTETTELKKEPKVDAENILTLNRYLNFKILAVSDTWSKVIYNSQVGYLPSSKLTSEAVTPKIREFNRIAVIKAGVNINMDLSKPSGLTLSDFKTVLGYNERDVNHIFSDNVEVFYKAEHVYNINGIFLASIGIHESAWGTSFLAKEKNNLFGYMAYDRDPINSAKDFETYEDCINTVAKALSNNYLTPTGSYYNGTSVAAVNIKYASDKAWHTKVFSYMEYLYGKLEQN